MLLDLLIDLARINRWNEASKFHMSFNLSRCHISIPDIQDLDVPHVAIGYNDPNPQAVCRAAVQPHCPNKELILKDFT